MTGRNSESRLRILGQPLRGIVSSVLEEPMEIA